MKHVFLSLKCYISLCNPLIASQMKTLAEVFQKILWHLKNDNFYNNLIMHILLNSVKMLVLWSLLLIFLNISKNFIFKLKSESGKKLDLIWKYIEFVRSSHNVPYCTYICFSARMNSDKAQQKNPMLFSNQRTTVLKIITLVVDNKASYEKKASHLHQWRIKYTRTRPFPWFNLVHEMLKLYKWYDSLNYIFLW